jgi:hypothetical protein
MEMMSTAPNVHHRMSRIARTLGLFTGLVLAGGAGQV